MKLDKIKVGKIVTAVGLKGEVKVYPYTDYPERFEELEYVEANEKKLEIKKVRYKKNIPIIKFKNIDNRNDAEKLRNTFLQIDKENLRELEEDEYFIFDLIGLKVIDQDSKHIGYVSDIIQNTAQDIYEIESEDGKKYLIPAVHEIVTDIDINNGIMIINPIEGLLD